VADVACHHAHVAVYLALHNIASRVIGTELTEGSWHVAQDTVFKYRVQDRVTIRLGDGMYLR
jgi:tRNA A22 N-methylase